MTTTNQPAPPVHVELKLLPCGEPIQGTVAVAAGPASDFTGWVALSLILEAALRAENVSPS